MTADTKLPIYAVEHSWERISIHDATGDLVATLEIDSLVDEETQDYYEEKMDDRAALIVRAVNAHQGLVDALGQWKRAEATGDTEELENARKSRDAALAKAQGE